MNMITHQPFEGQVVNADDYYFYHTIDLPGLGEMIGEWDLRPSTDNYLEHVSLTSKRVLEMGAANGFLSFYMGGGLTEFMAKEKLVDK